MRPHWSKISSAQKVQSSYLVQHHGQMPFWKKTNAKFSLDSSALLQKGDAAMDRKKKESHNVRIRFIQKK